MTRPPRRRLLQLAAGALLCAWAAPARAKQHRVIIDNVRFTPREIRVKKGDTVVWVNNDDRAHTVTADDRKSFRSGNLNSGDTFDHTFDKAGTYKYHCDYHPRMKATVVVQE